MLFSRPNIKKTQSNEDLFYINSEQELVNKFSSYSLIEKEFRKIGLETADATIEELMAEISCMFLDGYADRITENENYSLSEFKETEYYKIRFVLLSHLKEVAFYLYNFDEKKMPRKIKAFYKKKINS
jgi:pyridoxine/pyridoxamine 5'-phosphate oxidase